MDQNNFWNQKSLGIWSFCGPAKPYAQIQEVGQLRYDLPIAILFKSGMKP